MKSKFIKLIILGVSILLTGSCTKSFPDINTNPNNPNSAPLTNVFASTLVDLGSTFGLEGIAFPATYAGYATRATYNTATNYGSMPLESFWSTMLGTFSLNINTVMQDAQKESNNNALGAAIVIKAYGMQMLVDAYGPIPYFDAGKGNEGNFKPKYDNEKDIYADLIKQLDKANDLFDNNSIQKIGIGDILLGNDMELWKKFGNSLQLRIAIRMSNVDQAAAKQVIDKILDNPAKYPVLESNDDNIMLKYPGGGDWREPWTAASDIYVDIKIGAPIVDTLKVLNDPRLSQYAAPNSNGEYVGLEIGADGNNTTDSKINSQFVANETGSVPLLKYSEVEFIKAEAYARGLATGDAAGAYKKAITASMMEYGISQSEIDTYLTQPKVVWNGDLTRLYEQKWIALFRESWEAWAEMRRTDVPKLGPAVNSVYTGHNRPPFRFPYPSSEKSLNSSNIPKNVKEVDNYWGYQIWWDTRLNVH